MFSHVEATAKRLTVMIGCVLLAACGNSVKDLGSADCGKGYFAGDNGVCLHWPAGSQVSYSFHSSVSQELSTAHREKIQNAVTEWNGLLGDVQLNFNSQATTEAKTDDGINSISAVSSGWTRSASTQAYTQVLSDGKEIIEFDIYLNLQHFPMTLDSDPQGVHLQSLVMHELGHALGLTHNSEQLKAIMYPTLGYGVERDDFNSTDVQRLSLFYALRPGITAEMFALHVHTSGEVSHSN